MRLISTTLGFALALGLAGGAAANSTAQDAGRAAATPPADAASTASPDEPIRRLPLIREGSRLVGVRGLVGRDSETRSLRIAIDDDDPQSPGHELVLLPSSRLTELEVIYAAAGRPEAGLLMRVTGRVFVFRDRNYLMLTHPAVAEETITIDADAPPKPADESARANDEPADPDDPDAIARELSRDVGAVARRPSSDGPEAEGTATAKLLREGTRLVDRRGKIRRTPGGGYRLVLDAGASGEADPPMILLPCRILERLAALAGRQGDEAAVLISGEVTTHGGRNFLLPSVFRLPRERTRLDP